MILDIVMKFKGYLIGLGAIIVLILAGLLWHEGKVSDYRDQINKEWENRIANAPRETTIVRKPYYIKLPDTSGTTAARMAYSAKYDSAQRAWALSNANKDSLLAYYTQDASTTIKPDTIGSKMEITYIPLASPDKRFVYDWQPGKIKAESVQVSIEGLVPMPTPWYDSKTAHFIYGAVAGGVAAYLIGK